MKNKVNKLFDNATDIVGVARRIAYEKEITLDQAMICKKSYWSCAQKDIHLIR